MIKTCYDRILPRDLARIGVMSMISRLAIVTGKRWINGSTLRIGFIGGTSQQRTLVKKYSFEWCSYANLKFQFVDSGSSEIRVAFDEGAGAWSYVGTDCLELPQDQPTMNLGWQDQGVILHEFGHALGAIHEHQSPNAGIKWNKPVVDAALSGPPNNWSQDRIDSNIYEKYDRTLVNASVFDPYSTMLYFFPASWTLDGWHSEENEILSSADKDFISQMYPKPITPVEENVIPVSFITEVAAAIARPGEEDLYILHVITAGNYTIQTHGGTDVVMSVFGPNSKTAKIATDDDSGEGNNSLLNLSLNPGKYFVSVRHYSKSKTGTYSVSALKK